MRIAGREHVAPRRLIAVFHAPRPRTLGLVMGSGSGVLLSAVSFELIDEAVETSGRLRGAVLGLLVGAILFTVGDVVISRFGYAERKESREHRRTRAD